MSYTNADRMTNHIQQSRHSGPITTAQFVDHRTSSTAQLQLQGMMNASPQSILGLQQQGVINSPVLQGAFWERDGEQYIWHGGEIKADDSYEATEETRRGKTNSTKKNQYTVYIKKTTEDESGVSGLEEGTGGDESYVVEEPSEPTHTMSFEAGGDGSHALASVSNLVTQIGEDDFYDVQVGFYEAEDALMPGTAENVEQLQALERSEELRGRLRVRVNYSRDATRESSPTRYDQINIRNIMAGNDDGSSNTSFEANNLLTRGVFKAQSVKLKKGGRLHFAASGRPFFKPGDHRDYYDDRVKVDDIATENGLTGKVNEEYVDDLPVKKNKGAKDVGVSGTYTRVYAK